MKQARPPKLAVVLLSRFCREELKETIEGDLHELFVEDLEAKGRSIARRNYWANALMMLRYHRLRDLNSNKTHTMGLFVNYLKVATRDLKRHRVFTAINLFGLVAGFTVSLFMLEYVLHELSFDRFHSKADRIYRVINDRYQNGEMVQHGTITYPTIGPTMKADFPEVEDYTRLTLLGNSYVNYHEEIHVSEHVLAVDEHFLSIFDFSVTYGEEGKGNLDDPYEVVFTEGFASRLLSNDQSLRDLIGKTVRIGRRSACTITAIVADPPVNSHLQFDFLTSYATFVALAGEGADNSWNWSDFYHYLLLKPGADMARLDAKMETFGKHYFKEGEVSGAEEVFYLQPLLEAHLDPSQEYEIGRAVNGKMVWSMLFIAIFIVVIAWVNFTNLTTSRALQRSKEVGIRKSLGANRKQIVYQVAMESLLLNVGALILSIGVCLTLQPYFNQLTGIQLTLLQLLQARVFGLPFPVVFLLVFVATVVMSSLYPGAILSAFRMQDVIKGNFATRGEIAGFKRGLIVFQYCISLLLIVGSVGVGRQINFMMDKDLGMDIDKTLVVSGPAMTSFDSLFIGKIDRFKTELKSLSGVQEVTASSRVAGERTGRIFSIKSSADPEAKDLSSNFISTDHNFADVFQLSILSGRGFDFSDHHFNGADVENLIINEAAVRKLRFDSPDEAVGRTVNFWNKDWTIIGVVKDFHQLSLHHEIESIFLVPYYETRGDFSIKLAGIPSDRLLEAIESRYNEIFPGNYFDYYFLEAQYMQLYTAEFRVQKIVGVFTFLSIVIAALGLYGLVLISITRKTKEIGLRRVLGASLEQVFFTIGKEFFVLIIIAIVISGPLSYWLLSRWSMSFAYATWINPISIVIAALSLFGLAVLVILLQMHRVSRANPADSLRYE